MYLSGVCVCEYICCVYVPARKRAYIYVCKVEFDVLCIPTEDLQSNDLMLDFLFSIKLQLQHEKDFWAEYDVAGDDLQLDDEDDGVWDLDEDGDCAL